MMRTPSPRILAGYVGICRSAHSRHPNLRGIGVAILPLEPLYSSYHMVRDDDHVTAYRNLPYLSRLNDAL